MAKQCFCTVRVICKLLLHASHKRHLTSGQNNIRNAQRRIFLEDFMVVANRYFLFFQEEEMIEKLLLMEDFFLSFQ